MSRDRIKNEFFKELQALINKYSLENNSNTPDFLLASYLMDCLKAWDTAVCHRERWHGRNER